MKFEKIYRETEENMRLALTSLWTPGSHPMRTVVNKLFDDEPLLAEPVFQSSFGWEITPNDDWRTFLNREIVSKLKIGEKYTPYKHQADSWKALSEGRSIVVTSGTGSGKTECFMYPVISDLYEQGCTNEIQAIFLYPLNALMEDQKHRLSDYCSKTGLRFAVYNGDTPEFRADGRDDILPNEVKTREDIRDIKNQGTRPQILLTNPSMLEYILVRQKDQKMLQDSAGKLRWIIIDEAHSYSGSSAVEMAYQIKRILEAFQVRAEDVRFACTSATIGGQDGAQSLAEFISTITGQSVTQIKVIGGNRLVPSLNDAKLTSTLTENEFPSTIKRVVSLRKRINEVPGMTLRQIWEWLRPELSYDSSRVIPALQLVDKLCEMTVDGLPVMSLRGHFFMRSISGIYCCANPNCNGTSGTPYGHLTTYKAAVCPKCGMPLLEIVQCKRCGGFVLMGTSDSQTHKIAPCEDGVNREDYFSIDLTPEQEDEDELMSSGNPDTFFLLPHEKKDYFNPLSDAHMETVDIIHTPSASYFRVDTDNNGHWVEVRKDNGLSYCPDCGLLAKGQRLNFKHFRIPISFMNETISPVFLKECAPDGKDWGKYIAFTDSRQGTAISAKTFNIEVERRMCRQQVITDLAKRKGCSLMPINEAVMASFTPEQRAEVIKAMAAAGATSSTLSLNKVSELIYNSVLFNHMTGEDVSADIPAYKAALMRQFIGRRGLYESGPESLGLITLEYPDLVNVKRPEILVEYCDANNLKITDQDWRDYLKISLDYFIRLGNHIQPLIDGERKYIRDSNLSRPISSASDRRVGIDSWPKVKCDSQGNVNKGQSRLVTLLCAGLGIDSISKLQTNMRIVDGLMDDAWNTLVEKKVLTVVDSHSNTGYNNPVFFRDSQYVGCYYLDLSGVDTNNVCRIKKTESVWECPVSGKLLDTLFCGISPMIVGELSAKLIEKYRCRNEKIMMPERPKDRGEINSWMQSDANIAELKNKGLWSDRHKYVYQETSTYVAAEHSAQQSKKLLKEYTKAFSQANPAINVLHCSTTMEMGVDIGDIDIVLMDTIPPTAANYLQRVGRAGRMGQTKAVAFSLCNNTPVGQHAFANPMWALQTTNHMVKVAPSQTIIQRHINSFFFRQFICQKGEGIQATLTVGDFMTGICDAFVQFLDEMSTKSEEEQLFHKVFGANIPFTIEMTRNSILGIQKEYKDTISELQDAFQQNAGDERRQLAISNQIRKSKRENLLGYLSEHQFIPNASMPTGVVTFDFIDRDQFFRLHKLYERAEKLGNEIELAVSDDEKAVKKSALNKVRREIEDITRSTTASRDIHTALNEYAPEQTVVVNEKNYVSAGVTLFGAYNEETQTRAIYHCTHCGNTEYSRVLDEHKKCSKCNEPYHSIIDPDHGAYTLAYEPIGFRTDQTVDSSREEKTDKRYYDIRPVLLKADWSNPAEVNLCKIASSGETGEILFYNVGTGYGFAMCKRCGRAALEVARHSPDLPYGLKLGHKRLWGDECDANENDIVRHVVLTGRHQTCYSVLKFKDSPDSRTYVNDDQVVYSLGVILKRALVEYLGIDDGEVDFGIKQEQDAWVLFIYDTARGGCGYSLHFMSPVECQEIFDIARRKLEEYTCRCHIDGGACARCLIDSNNYRYANKLSKGKALDWLNMQKGHAVQVPADVLAVSPSAKTVYQSLKDIARQAANSSETTSLTLCVSDQTDDYVITDWSSIRSEMGKIIQRAVEGGKHVSIRVEYHPELHISNVDKLPFANLGTRFPDCEVKLVKDMGSVKTAIIVETGERHRRYITDQDSSLSFSNNWGNLCTRLFVDSMPTDFDVQPEPQIITSPFEVIREGLTSATSFCVANYFSKAIAPYVLHDSDEEMLSGVLSGKYVNITFSDMYVNSALASLMLVYLIKEVRNLFDFTIDSVKLQLDSPKRKCNCLRFNDYTPIHMNFENKDEADAYTDELFENILDIVPEHLSTDADHHRWLRIETMDGGLVEIRPDHGISGGYTSRSQYMNLESLGGSVKVYKSDEDVLYYIIIRRP